MSLFDGKMILYIVIIVLLIVAFASVNIYKDLSAKKNYTSNNTKNDTNIGFCNVPQDCENQDLVHILCTGNWVCEQKRCGWVCGAEQQDGLSGSTVECYDDSHCQTGKCPDGSSYKRYACSGNKCAEINYFADPCKYR